ncbi:MAG: hypothetical protein V4672_07375 [Verrucomicrobiota bacterium]
MKGVTDMFIAKDKLAIFWFLVSCGCIIGTGWYLHGQALLGRGRMLFVPIEQHDVFMARDMKPQDLNEAADFHTRLLMETLLNRGPKGPVNNDRLEQLLIGNGLDQARLDIRDNSFDFDKRKIHQMLELGRVDIVHNPDDGSAITSTEGQLIRVSFDPTLKETVVQSFLVSATMQWQRNPSLRANKRFMFVCSDITYSLEEFSSSEKKP